MADLERKTPDPAIDPRRINLPEGLRRARKSAYGPTTGRHGERAEEAEAPRAQAQDQAARR